MRNGCVHFTLISPAEKDILFRQLFKVIVQNIFGHQRGISGGIAKRYPDRVCDVLVVSVVRFRESDGQ